MIIHPPPKGMGHQLVPVADAEQGHANPHGPADPVGRRLAPVQPVRDHGPGTGDDGRPVLTGLGQCCPFEDTHHLHRIPIGPERLAEPVGQIALGGADIVRRSADLKEKHGIGKHGCSGE